MRAHARSQLGFVLLWVVLGSACDGDAGAPEDLGPTTAFTEAPCREIDVPAGLSARCGMVRVPEVPGDPASRSIDLQVAIFPAADPAAKGEPILYLHGPAGGSSTAAAVYYAAWAPDRSLRVLMERHDLVAIDLRGTGGSLPRLDCPDLAVTGLRAGAPIDAVPTQALRRCLSGLRQQGIAVQAYGTAQAAHDVEQIRRALGITRANLLGVGYGARVALEVARAHPGGLRAVVLDSLTPPDVDALAEEAPALADALDAAFGRCAAEPDCAGRFPDLSGVLTEIVARLEANPVEVDSHGASVVFDGRTFVAAVAGLLREGDAGGQLPQRLFEAQAGQYGFFAAVLGAPRGQGALGVDFTVTCAERMAATSAQAIEARAGQVFAPAALGLAGRFYALACPLWEVPAAPAGLRAPVASGVPTLLLGGQVDPHARPAWSRAAAGHLGRAQVIELGGGGHALMRGLCGARLAATFFAQPGTPLTAAVCAGP